MRFFNVALVLLVVFSAFGYAEDQRVTIDTKPCLIDQADVGASIDVQQAKIDDQSKAINLIQKIAQCVAQSALVPPSDRGTDKDPRFYIIHVLRYKDGQLATEASNWYVFHSGWLSGIHWYDYLHDQNIKGHFNEKRIYGSPDVSIVYVHLNVPAALNGEAALRSAQVPIKDIPGIMQGQAVPGNRDITNEAGQRLQPYGSALVAVNYTDVLYKVSVTKKLPSNVENLRDGLIAAVQSEQAAPIKVTTRSIAVCNLYDMSIAHLPSDMTVGALVGRGERQKELEKQTFDNEGKHYWDVSFALPLKTYKDIEYKSDTGSIQARKIERQNVFGTFNLYIPHVDTKSTNFRFIPHLMYGLPIQGKVLHRHLLAAGMGLNKVEAFAGITFDKRESDTEAIPSKWVRKFSFGINVPVRTALDAFKSAKDKDK
jgi:hypothetical protein